MAVEFNDEGLDIIGGLKSKQQIRESQNLHITGFENMGEFFTIDVDQPSLNMFLFTNHDLDEKR